MREQLDCIDDTDWDLLLVLDAFRWDVWDATVGEGEPVHSPGNCSRDWIRNLHRELDFSDVVCITANPEVTRWSADFLYAERDDIWKRGWEYVNGIGTVPPATMTEAIEARLVVGPDRPIYAHYVQPHGPYPMADPPLPVMRNNPEANEVHTDIDYHPDEIIMNPTDLLNDEGSWMTDEALREAYMSNVEWVLAGIQPLLDRGRTVAVTSDHGEILGEERTLGTDYDPEVGEYDVVTRYGHPCGDADDPLLRTVPWAVYEP